MTIVWIIYHHVRCHNRYPKLLKLLKLLCFASWWQQVLECLESYLVELVEAVAKQMPPGHHRQVMPRPTSQSCGSCHCWAIQQQVWDFPTFSSSRLQFFAHTKQHERRKTDWPGRTRHETSKSNKLKLFHLCSGSKKRNTGSWAKIHQLFAVSQSQSPMKTLLSTRYIAERRQNTQMKHDQ